MSLQLKLIGYFVKHNYVRILICRLILFVLIVDAGLLISTAEKSNPSLAPTKEALSLRAYSARRRLNRLRKQSCRLFQNEDTVKLIKKLEIEIESNHLAVRKDRKLHADLGALFFNI